MVRIAEATALAYQATGQGILTVWEDRRQRMAGRPRREVCRVPIAKVTGAD
jgi:hypothetical protein